MALGQPPGEVTVTSTTPLPGGESACTEHTRGMLSGPATSVFTVNLAASTCPKSTPAAQISDTKLHELMANMLAINLCWAHDIATDARADVLCARRAHEAGHAGECDEQAGTCPRGGAITTGTLYLALDRLVREGLIELVREETVNGRPQDLRPYP